MSQPCKKCSARVYLGVGHTCPDTACYYHIPVTQPSASRARPSIYALLKAHNASVYEMDFAEDGKECYVRFSDFQKIVDTLTTSPEARAGDCDAAGVTVYRNEDMSPNGRLGLIAQDDGDMCVTVAASDGAWASVEFCASGGNSPKTLQALRNLSQAMQADRLTTKDTP